MTLLLRENDASFIRTAASIIQKNGTVPFPTETVYWLGANALSFKAVAKIFRAKNRPADNTLIVHIADKADLEMLAREVPDIAFDLVDAFWPGPLTLILKRLRIVPDITTGALDSVGIRMPDHKIALALISEAGVPIAAPSANTSGKPSPTTASHVIDDLFGKIDAIIEGGPTRFGIESTVLDLTVEVPTLLRPGAVGLEELINCIGEVRKGYHDHTFPLNVSVKSPGMKYVHYAPNAKMILVEGKRALVIDRINQLVLEYKSQGMHIGVLITKESAEQVSADHEYILGSIEDLHTVASNLFTGFRYFDELRVDLIIAEGVFPSKGVGAAIMNRLRKAASTKIYVGLSGCSIIYPLLSAV